MYFLILEFKVLGSPSFSQCQTGRHPSLQKSSVGVGFSEASPAQRMKALDCVQHLAATDGFSALWRVLFVCSSVKGSYTMLI